MNDIVNNMRDPSWWFTAFFIAIITSVIAGFAKDYIGKALASLSSSFKTRMQLRVSEKNAQIEQLLQNETLLILKFIQAGVGAIFLMLIFIMFLLSPMWAETMYNWCSTFPSDPTCRADSQFLPIFGSAFFGILGIVFSYKAATTLEIATEAVRAYRRKCADSSKKD